MQFEEQKQEKNIFKPLKIKLPFSISQSQINKLYAIAHRSYIIFVDKVIQWGQITYKIQKQHDKLCAFEQSKNFCLIAIKVNQLAFGCHHTFAYSKNQQKCQQQIEPDTSVYCWGSNKNYELGFEGRQAEKQYGLVKVEIFDEALEAGLILSQISCGDSHTLAVFKDEQNQETKLFGWGDSSSYQLALDVAAIVPYPVDIQYDFATQISKVYSKSDYNIAITKKGDLYSWGSNLFNRLGLNHLSKTKLSNDQNQIDSFQNQNKIKSINSPNTSRQSLNFLKCQENFQKSSFTDRQIVQIQTSQTNNQKVKIPRKIQIFNKKIVQLALGTYHVVALSLEGECFSWGNGIYGQLGNNKYGECEPEKITTKHLPLSIKFVGCCAGKQHSCILDSEGNVYTCGSNACGVLGHQKHQNQTRKKRCKIFQKIQYFQQNNIKIQSVTSGDRHLLTLSINKQIFGWGSNNFNQILLSFDQTQKTLKETHTKTQEYEKRRQQTMFNYFSQTQAINSATKSILMSQANTCLKFISNSEENKIENYLNEMPSNPKSDLQNKLIDWKIKFTKFIEQKRKEEDLLLQELDQLFNAKFK